MKEKGEKREKANIEVTSDPCLDISITILEGQILPILPPSQISRPPPI